MEIRTKWVTPDGQECELAFSMDLSAKQEADTDFNDARARVYRRLQSEVQRMGEYIFVALADAHTARLVEEEERQARMDRKRRGVPEPPRGPNQVIGPGRDQTKHRLIQIGDELIPASEAVKKGLIDG